MNPTDRRYELLTIPTEQAALDGYSLPLSPHGTSSMLTAMTSPRKPPRSIDSTTS